LCGAGSRRLSAYLQNLSAACSAQRKSIEGVQTTYAPTKGNEFDFQLITDNIQSKGLIDPLYLLHEYNDLLLDLDASKIPQSLLNLSNQMRMEDAKMAEFIQPFKVEYEKIAKVFVSNLFELSKLHDELRNYVKGKSLKKEVQDWIRAYLDVFQTWASAGATKDIALLRNEVVLKIAALNRIYPEGPFIAQTDEKALKCEVAYEEIIKLDKQFMGKLKSYKWVYRKATKLLPLMIKALENSGQSTQAAQKPAIAWHINYKKTGLIALAVAIVLGILVTMLYLAQPMPPKSIPVVSTSTETEISFYAGHSQPMPHDSNQILSQTEHFQLVKPLIDSLNHKISVKGKPDIKYPVYGIDISHYQGKIDWVQVGWDTTAPKPIHFVIMKATQGTKRDPAFKANWSGAQKISDKIGAYHFFSFKVDPVKQAQNFIRTVHLQPGHIRPIVDIEPNCSDCFDSKPLSNTQLIENVRLYLAEIERHYQCKAIIYSGDAFYHTYLKGHFAENHFWLAAYNKNSHLSILVEDPFVIQKKEPIICWQFTPKASVRGIKGDVDMNYLPGIYQDSILIQER